MTNRRRSTKPQNLDEIEAFRLGGALKVSPAVTDDSFYRAGSQLQLGQRKSTVFFRNKFGSEFTMQEFYKNPKRFRVPRRVMRLYAWMTTSRKWMAFITIVVVYALVGDDMRIAFFPMTYDSFFDALQTFSFLIFFFELVMNCWVEQEKYIGSYYFWLDLAATISMIPDIHWLWAYMYELWSNHISTAATNTLSGSTSSRVVRIVRLVRLVRVAKFFGISQKIHGEFVNFDREPSVVGVKLADMTMKRVVTLVLLMLIIMPFFDSTFYSNLTRNDLLSIGLGDLHRAAQDLNCSTSDFVDMIHSFVRQAGWVLYISICNGSSDCKRYNNITGGDAVLAYENGINNIWSDFTIIDIARETEYWDPDLQAWLKNDRSSDYIPSEQLTLYREFARLEEKFRANEILIAEVTGCYGPEHHPVYANATSCVSRAYLEARQDALLQAILNIMRTIFLALILIFGNLVHKADADKIVIKPIERMVLTVRQFAENPMASMNRRKSLPDADQLQNNGEAQDETAVLESMLRKIEQLLQIGFGEAGARIIAKNMKHSGKSGHEIDPMIEGQKITAVFGFCDIRNFTDTTECLQEKVMVYVNRVGKIVHEATALFYGAANKNIGDAFLLVWRLEDKRGGNDDLQTGNLCDNALLAFLKVLVDLKRENAPGGCLHRYKRFSSIRQRFGDDFEIKLGMGLHIGWAIEGAIGSKYKIDASYLSPNVNIAARLEAATKQFRSSLLLSDEFYDTLSPKGRSRCRMIDKVAVKGSLKPMAIYTFDITDFPQFFAEAEYDEEGERIKFTFDNEQVANLQKTLSEEFVTVFRRAVDSYIDGNWLLSRDCLKEALVLRPEDGPSISLLEVLERHDFKAPANWPGYRQLTEK